MGKERAKKKTVKSKRRTVKKAVTMNKEEALKLLGAGKKGIKEWNKHRREGHEIPNLSGVDLSRAYLTAAQLHGAKLSRANLNEADLNGADLNGADLEGANLMEADLSGANLQGANLAAADLYKASLVKANLQGANLTEAILFEAISANAKFQGANLDGAELQRADLEGANLTGANLANSKLSSADLGDANFTGANLKDCDLDSATLNRANLSEADLTGANIWGISHTEWNVKGIKAEYVYYCANRYAKDEEKIKFPPDRNFRPTEFQEWLGKLSSVEKLSLDDIPKVFISYSWADKKSMQAVDQWLRDKGVRVIVDERDFIVGADIRDEIVRWLRKAVKVVCIYSKDSADRPYPKLERRLAEEREFDAQKRGKKRIILIYLCIDDTPLPQESAHRLAIMVKNKSFQEACEELWAAILEKGKEPKRIDLKQYDKKPPWKIK
jgi:uncharacterized protein YjbI with pentapeptide repeats